VRLLSAEPQLRSVDTALAAGAIMAAGSAATCWLSGVPCPFFLVTGRYCAGCGATRAVLALIHGHPDAALRDNGLVLAIVAFVAIRFAARYTGGQALVASVDRVIEHVDMRVWTILLVCWTVLRNLPWFAVLGPAR